MSIWINLYKTKKETNIEYRHYTMYDYKPEIAIYHLHKVNYAEDFDAYLKQLIGIQNYTNFVSDAYFTVFRVDV